MKSTVGDGKRRSGLFLGRLWWVGELSTADTCQGFWGYNREAFRKKRCLLTNTGGYVWCTVHECMCVCVHLLVCVNAYIILLRPCNQWKSQFHVSSTHNQPPITLWKILGMVPCSLLPLRSGRRFTADEQGLSQRTLPAIFGQLSPMSWLPAIYSQ